MIKIGGYYRIGEITPDEVLPFVGQNNFIYFFGHVIKLKSLRYHTFKISTKCVCCGINGVIFIVEKSCLSNRIFHMNLYGFDENNNLRMITKDHIIPKSKGGKDHISNMQTMCKKCNEEKGILLPGEFKMEGGLIVAKN